MKLQSSQLKITIVRHNLRSLAHWSSGSAPGSQPGGTGFDSRPGRYFDMRNILGQDVHSHVLRSTKPSILLGSVNWYQLRLGLMSFVQLQERRTARLAAGVGAVRLTHRMPQCALLRSPFLPACLPPCKAVLFLICKSRYIKAKTFNLLTFIIMPKYI